MVGAARVIWIVLGHFPFAKCGSASIVGFPVSVLSDFIHLVLHLFGDGFTPHGPLKKAPRERGQGLLEADLDKNLGLTPQQWQLFLSQLSELQHQLLSLKQGKVSDTEIAQRLGYTTTQVQKQWFKLLEVAWEIRNHLVSGERDASNE